MGVGKIVSLVMGRGTTRAPVGIFQTCQALFLRETTYVLTYIHAKAYPPFVAITRVVPKLPAEDQHYLAKTIEMLAQKHGVTE